MLPRYVNDLNRSVVDIVDLKDFKVIHTYKHDVDHMNDQVINKAEFPRLKIDGALIRFQYFNPIILENGSLISKFKGPNLKKVNDILYKLFIGSEIKKGFSFQTKYKNSSDLRPNVIDYDECFIKVLFESKVHNLIFDCLGADYLLSHIQIRKLEAGNTYLDWHRDSYNYGKKVLLIS